ncbi:MAG: hypothetical protein HQK65_07080 [Desulfamplus sp.]|nr:hypothetical protein [Desulfamplus sp.]
MEAKRYIRKIHTPQLYIDLPPSFINRNIEILIIPLDEVSLPEKQQKRKPPAALAGKVKDVGDVMSSAPLSEWGIE